MRVVQREESGTSRARTARVQNQKKNAFRGENRARNFRAALVKADRRHGHDVRGPATNDVAV